MNRGHYSQLDIVLATRVGVVVYEVKGMSGWILGSGRIRGQRGGDSLASNRRPKRWKSGNSTSTYPKFAPIYGKSWPRPPTPMAWVKALTASILRLA